MKTVFVIGAGQLGSRHIQSLKNSKHDLRIYIVDPFQESLNIAKERFDSFPSGGNKCDISYHTEIISVDTVDFAIISTSSNVRRQVVSELLLKSSVKYMLLEKILFNKEEDYYSVDDLLKKNGVKAWVNCSMRKMPFYNSLKKDFFGQRLHYCVTGSKYGLVTNAIHYIDHMAYLVGSNDFEIDTNALDKEVIPSKRKGFAEFNGSIIASFPNGSLGVFSCMPTGNLPVQIDIYSTSRRVISREGQGYAIVASEESKWEKSEIPVTIPYQSQMTSEVMDEIFRNETCPLTEYSESMTTHLRLLKPLMKHYAAVSRESIDFFPFT